MSRPHLLLNAPKSVISHFILAFALMWCALISPALKAQLYEADYFSRKEMLQDLGSLKATILSSHEDPFGFCSPEEFETAFDSACATLADSSSVSGFSLVIADFINVMRDSHSCLDYSALHEYVMHNEGYLLPVRIVSDESGIYVAQDRDQILPKGSKILSIDGYPVDSIWNIAYRYSCIEGNAIVGKRRVADAIFPIILGLHMPPEEKAIVDVTPFDSVDIFRYTYRTYDLKRWKARQKALARVEPDQAVKFSFPTEDVALLSVNTFAPRNSFKYSKEIRNAFQEIREANPESLIIDLRDNGGGSSSWVEYLYSFIDVNGYNTPHNIIGKNSDLARNRSFHLQRRWNRFFLKLFYPRNEDIQGFLTMFNRADGVNDTIYFHNPSVQRKDIVFSGNCYLLMNGMTASASVDFSNQFIRKKRGTTLGESCFGPSSGTWGNPARYLLPLSKIPVYISTIRYNYDNSFEYILQPLKPDVALPLNQQTLSLGEDTYLKPMLEFIKQHQP